MNIKTKKKEILAFAGVGVIGALIVAQLLTDYTNRYKEDRDIPAPAPKGITLTVDPLEFIRDSLPSLTDAQADTLLHRLKNHATYDTAADNRLIQALRKHKKSQKQY